MKIKKFEMFPWQLTEIILTSRTKMTEPEIN